MLAKNTSRPVALWLFTVAGLIALMVVVGGATRLTDSGLSITQWDLVMCTLPPLSAADWEEAFALSIADRTEGYVLRHRGLSATVLVCTPRAAELHARLPEKEPVDTAKLVTSPMPGLVVSIAVETGQEVKAGEALMVVEAMKMENVLRAEVDGVIKQIACEPGASVAADELLIEFE